MSNIASQCTKRTRTRASRSVLDRCEETCNKTQALNSRASITGLQIPLIENLASHIGTYDTLNMTDNALISLGNIPLGQSSYSPDLADVVLISSLSISL